jgi:hypothetical protein
MSNGASASPEPASRATTRPALAIKPLPWPEPGQAHGPARRRHAHSCLSCGATYECRGPEEIGYCAPVCQPCYWIELGSQLRIYKEVVTELERKRSGIERRLGKGFCRSAAARRRKMRNDASLFVAFGKVVSTQPAHKFAGLNTEAQGGGSHGE